MTAPSLRAGDLVAGKYRLESEIGVGGMGVVYSAIHVDLDQRVALKFLRPEAAQNAEVVERFTREARAAVKVHSEHVARIMDIGRLEGGLPYIVMEYLEGSDLEQVVEENGPLAVPDAVRYVLEACEALAEVHVEGIVHRDIKPANLFLAARADGTSIVKLLDFGISKSAPPWADGGAPALTQTSAVMGSPRYMAPEQLRSSRDVDARADVWAIGVTLFELLGGQSPFATGTMPEVCASILKDDPLPLAGLRPDVPAELETAIRRCLAKQPADRWPNVAELAIALRPFGPKGIIDISIERIVGVIQTPRSRERSGPIPRVSPPTTTPMPMPFAMDAAVEPTPPEVTRPPAPTTPPAPLTAPARMPQASTPPPDKATSPELASPKNLEEILLKRIGNTKRVPRPAVAVAQVTQLALDHRAGFILALVDGFNSIDDILDISGMQRLEALQVLCVLVDRKIIKLP